MQYRPVRAERPDFPPSKVDDFFFLFSFLESDLKFAKNVFYEALPIRFQMGFARLFAKKTGYSCFFVSFSLCVWEFPEKDEKREKKTFRDISAMAHRSHFGKLVTNFKMCLEKTAWIIELCAGKAYPGYNLQLKALLRSR